MHGVEEAERKWRWEDDGIHFTPDVRPPRPAPCALRPRPQPASCCLLRHGMLISRYGTV